MPSLTSSIWCPPTSLWLSIKEIFDGDSSRQSLVRESVLRNLWFDVMLSAAAAAAAAAAVVAL
jgi:hypothetical protein